ncbi:hypothetical protein PZ897_10580 [Hoeflea sp. YIM 152468]|uniref:hypothetical protein n=1 Tax=Hoeflea sp. YIM 152468 TaxID=3031759 RepID=UPI0023DA4B82|nr:hypothetical protein [Hoeflea sp. YIM 152468]MDF1608622.1 hypothetical protein [Hoeflea sp. YIM 152468]
MRNLVIALVFLLFSNGALLAATQSAKTADTAGQMMTEQSRPDAVKKDCCESPGSKMGHGYNSCAMDCHFLAPYIVINFRRTIPVKASWSSSSLTYSVEGTLMRPPIVS